MGACQSGDVSDPWAEGDDYNSEQPAGRKRTNKQTGELVAIDDENDNRPESDFFEFEEAVDVSNMSKEFLAVKPWKGQIAEPDDHPPVDPSKPDIQYALEYVYGYRCEDSRQNVYYNPDGNLCYMTACLGVILNKAENTQVFFGGGEVENESKQTASDEHHHNNDIMCMNVTASTDRQWAATGQVGKFPSVFVWNTQDGSKRSRFKLNKNSRQCSAIAISPDAKYVACADRSDEHMVFLFEVGSGQLYSCDKGGRDPIFDISFTKKDGEYHFWTAGKKHIAYWEVGNGIISKKKGLFGKSNPQTSFVCMTADNTGKGYGGGANSFIYVWNGRTCVKTLGFHEGGFVGAITWLNGILYSGGKDGRVNIIDCSNYEVKNVIQFPTLIRAIDVFEGSKLVVGLRTGSIVESDLSTGEQTTYMQSHNDGEVWGLTMDDAHVYTSGDDNQVKKWDPVSRTCVDTAQVSDKIRKAKRNKASSMGKHPESQAARALAVSSTAGHIAVCANDGSMTIRALSDFHTVLHEKLDSLEWIEVAEYSPDGQHLAVGSHDTNIYIYETSGYERVGKASKHNATITCIDWAMDGTYIKSVCNAYELLYFLMPGGDQDPSGRSNTTSTVWATGHAKFGWLVDGIFPRGTDGSHINGVDFNEEQSLIACGDDFGLVTTFRNPCRVGHMPRSYRGHSEHVVRTRFGRGSLAQWLFSVGGYDQTVMQWLKQ